MAKNAGLTLTEEDISTVVSGPGQTIGAVVLKARRGPLNERFLATSTKRFREKYGDEEPGYYGHYTALAALAEGPVYVVRTADSDDNPLYGGALFQDESATDPNAALVTGVADPATYTFTGDEALLIVADNPGLWGNSIKAILTHDANDSEVFSIEVYYPDGDGNYTLVEEWRVSRKALKKDGYGKAMYIEDVINDVSDYIRVKDNTNVADTVLPKEQVTQLQFGAGDDGTAPEDADIASAWDTYFSNKDDVSVGILMAGGYSAAVVANKLSEICGSRQDCVAILDPVNTSSYATAITNRDALSLTDPSYCAMYYPWVKDTDETNGKLLELPPSGYVAARIMRKNRLGNIHDSIFGPTNGVLPVEGVAVTLAEAEQELLAEAEINPIVKKPGYGVVIWGGRTLQAFESSRSWLNVRERLNADEQAVLDYLEPFIGKNNTAFLRFQVKAGLDNYFNPLIDDAYYNVLVVCDDTNNTSQTIDAGELHVDIYVQPVKPVNRILFKVIITRTGVSLQEVAAGAAA